MAEPKLVMLVKFKSALSLEEIVKVAQERADDYRALGGLLQKYYLEDPVAGEVAGLYFWESLDALDTFRKSELRASIASAYKIVGEPRIEVFKVHEILRETA
jgi:heme-degrading monooxygenase HmoA